ncbi:MAG: YkvA family protein [Phototrophicaceae bacterium]|jgi:uncharacterized membrane protein YkvA (DUF1232 family)
MSDNGNSPFKFNQANFLELFFHPEVPFYYKAILVGAILLYGFFPLDVISDAIPIIGQVDDVGLAIFAAQIFQNYARRYLEAAHAKEQAKQPAQPVNAQAQSSSQPADSAYPPTDFLHDQPHEQVIQRRYDESKDEFEELMRKQQERRD